MESRETTKIDLAQGWSSENCGDLTVGELFLIEGLGNRTNANMELTYCWRKKNQLNGAHELNPCSRYSHYSIFSVLLKRISPLS